MNRRAKITPVRDTQLMAMAGLVAAFLFATQLNLEEVLRIDRFQHLVVSAGLFVAFLFLFAHIKGRMALAFSATLGIGVIKELCDHQMQNFDLYADIFGIVLGLMVVLAFRFFIPYRLRAL